MDIVQNNKSNKSVDIKNDERLAPGTIKKPIAHSLEFLLSNNREIQSK